jgi:hypothetical protein
MASSVDFELSKKAAEASIHFGSRVNRLFVIPPKTIVALSNKRDVDLDLDLDVDVFVAHIVFLSLRAHPISSGKPVRVGISASPARTDVARPPVLPERRRPPARTEPRHASSCEVRLPGTGSASCVVA